MLYQLTNIHLQIGHRTLFNDLNMVIEKGDKIGILGLNGSGKSTLFKILNGTIAPDPISGTNYYHINKELLNEKPFLIPQEMIIPADHDNDKVIYNAQSYFEFIYPNDTLFSHTYAMYESYLKSFEFDNFHTSITQLSGGEQKKILLAIGLVHPSPCLLWDEPTNHLDFDTIMEFEKILLGTKKTFLIVTHDRILLSKVVDKLFIIHNQKLQAFHGQYPAYLEHLENQNAQLGQKIAKLKNHLRREDEWMKQGIKARGTRSKKRVENFEQLHGTISNLQNNLRKKWSLSLHESARKSKKLIEMLDLEIGYPNADTLLKMKELNVFQGEKIGIIGKSGSGKSTFIHTLLNLVEPKRGKIELLDGIKIVLFSQKRDSMPMEKSLVEYVGDGIEHIQRPNGTSIHISSYLGEFGFSSDVIHRPIKTFSGGEKNRLQLAKYLTLQADLYIFDEPTNDLDLESVELLERTLVDFNKAVMLVSHDRSFIENVCKKFFVIGVGSDKKEMIDLHVAADDLFSYLELEQIDNEIKLDNSAPVVNLEKKEKLTNAQKNLYKDSEKKMAKLEERIAQLQEQITNFDHSKKNGEYGKLCAELEKCEADWLELIH